MIVDSSLQIEIFLRDKPLSFFDVVEVNNLGRKNGD